ncbi:MAG TPA: hypothetical protein VEA78_02300, partial [Acidimicrobiales bacterium]|nr:hypothetical protein [Acidimicrobiales bacterium]
RRPEEAGRAGDEQALPVERLGDHGRPVYQLVSGAAGYTATMPPAVIAVLVAAAVAFGLSMVVRNTSGARPTGEPGALAGNLALGFVVVVAAIVGLAVLLG